MSMQYWGIVGYAVRYDESIIIDKDEDGEPFHSCDIQDIYDALTINNKEITPITIATDADDNGWIIYLPSAPWEITDVEKTFKCKEDVAKEMYRLFKPELKPEITEEYFVERIDWISTYNCG